MPLDTRTRYTHEAWGAEARRRFGANAHDWRFVCPSCGHVASVRDWKDAGAPEGAVAFSCVGRWSLGHAPDMFTKPGPCNYAGGGLIGLNPVVVTMPDGKEREVFDFAMSPEGA